MNKKHPLVGIVMGSDSDLEKMAEAAKVLEDFEVPFEITVSSAHRSPERTLAWTEKIKAEGGQVIIAGAGRAAHLAGVIAAHTTLPVIGVPIDGGPLNGVDALYATVQMPPGIPVGTMAIGAGGCAKCWDIRSANFGTSRSRLGREAASLQNENE